jgi:hypothetical protein
LHVGLSGASERRCAEHRERKPLPLSRAHGYWSTTECARRFRDQHASLSSRQSGNSSP